MTKYDLIIPLDMPSEAGFIGKSRRGGRSFNNEIGFSFGSWSASYHRINESAYIIIRLGVLIGEIENEIPLIVRMLAQASAMLDISIRPTVKPLKILQLGQHADLSEMSALPAGEMPLVRSRSESYGIQLPIDMLSDALSREAISDRKHKALQLFMDVDFEATPSSRFAMLSTILELLADRKLRDLHALEILSQWKVQAKQSERSDLAHVVDLMRFHSIAAAIGDLVKDAASEAGCSEQEIERFQKNAKAAYLKRNKLLHAGVSISIEELSMLRSIVRLVLVGRTSGTPFTLIGNKI